MVVENEWTGKKELNIRKNKCSLFAGILPIAHEAPFMRGEAQPSRPQPETYGMYRIVLSIDHNRPLIPAGYISSPKTPPGLCVKEQREIGACRRCRGRMWNRACFRIEHGEKKMKETM